MKLCGCELGYGHLTHAFKHALSLYKLYIFLGSVGGGNSESNELYMYIGIGVGVLVFIIIVIVIVVVICKR